ncbi:hypothetical protein DL95DRAFT_467440 [Leptodontidium sp. 2 PMI_412]|nr:hypothetical protein BKA61DRAFT_581672 [Leptodontidium sp. MPI-SDFR-AT-0119]KAH9208758.1 hypothetical protein DL95DRAFT_467440 [Leptodontidium sp. 2 PMI_412]
MTLESDHSSCSATIQRLSTNHVNVRNEVVTLRNRIRELEDKADIEDRLGLEQGEDELEKLRERKFHYKKEVKSLKKELVSKQQELFGKEQELSTAVSENDRLSNKLRQLKRVIASIDSEEEGTSDDYDEEILEHRLAGNKTPVYNFYSQNSVSPRRRTTQQNTVVSHDELERPDIMLREKSNDRPPNRYVVVKEHLRKISGR